MSEDTQQEHSQPESDMQTVATLERRPAEAVADLIRSGETMVRTITSWLQTLERNQSAVENAERVTAIPIGLYANGQTVSFNSGSGSQTVGQVATSTSLVLQLTSSPSSLNYNLTYSDGNAVNPANTPGSTTPLGGGAYAANITFSATPPPFTILTIKATTTDGQYSTYVSVQITA